MSRRPVVRPSPLWTWSLVWRTGEPNPLVHNVVEAFMAGVDRSVLAEPEIWLPDDDPHRATTA